MKSRILHSIRELGWRNAAWYGLAKLAQHLDWRVYRYLFFAQQVTARPLRQVRARSIDVRDIETATEIPDCYPRPSAVIAARFRQGAHSLAAWRGEELAGFLWYQFGAYQEDEVRVRYSLPSPDSAWDYDVYVQPHLRMGATFCRLWEEANRRLHARGVLWSCSRISAFNPDSLRAHARLGNVPMGCATFICCGGWQWMIASRPPWLHVSRRAASFPELVFDTRALDHGAVRCHDVSA